MNTSPESIPWEARLDALMPGGKADLAWLRSTFGPMRKAGWKDREKGKDPLSNCTCVWGRSRRTCTISLIYDHGIPFRHFYTPEGERKRVLALPIEEGR